MRRWGCSSRPRGRGPSRWTRGRSRRSSACAGRSPPTRTATATRPGCWSARPGALTRLTPPWPARRTWRRSGPRCMPASGAGPGGGRGAPEAARAAPPGPEPLRPVDVLLDAVALRVTQGYHAAAAALTGAVELLLALDADVGEARP